jgi:hypothetical protein
MVRVASLSYSLPGRSGSVAGSAAKNSSNFRAAGSPNPSLFPKRPELENCRNV